MKLSIVIPAFNEAELIGKTLESAQQAIAGKDAEIIVADNGSTDETASIVKGHQGVKLVLETKKGTNQARQAGLDASLGQLVANIDADNLIDAEWVDKALKAFEEDPKLVGLSGPYIYYDLGSVAVFLIKIYYRLAFLIFVIGNKLGHGAVMGGNVVFKKAALAAEGGYNTSLTFFGDDTDTANRLTRQGRVKFDYSFTIKSSARRLKKHGMVRTAFRYFLNHVWVTLFKKPFSRS